MAWPQYILFDFFGTLVSYRDRARNSQATRTQSLLSEWAQLAGVPLDQSAVTGRLDQAYDELESAAERTLREYHTFAAMRRLLALIGIPSSPEREERLGRAWIEDWRGSVHAPAGLPAMLAQLPCQCSVVSNTSTPWLVPQCLDEAGIADAFDHVVLSVTEGVRKPHPDIYHRALALADTAPEQTLFVGDNASPDYHGPRSVGIPAVLISSDPVPDVPEVDRIESVLELPSWIERRAADSG